MDDKSIVEIRDLIKRYNGRLEPAVDNISLKIHKGEIFWPNRT